MKDINDDAHENLRISNSIAELGATWLSLMKSMKTERGVSWRRNIQASVLCKWIYDMHATNNVFEGIEKLCNVRLNTVDRSMQEIHELKDIIDRIVER